MKRLAGQAVRTLAKIIQETALLVNTLFFILILAAGALAYRLSLGPMQIPWAATRLANAASGEDVVIHIGHAALAWQGYKKGSHAPLFLQLGDITVSNTAGARLASIPQAQLAFSLGAFFTARAPIYVNSENAHIAGSDVPISLLAGIRLHAAFTLASADLWVTLGPGRLGFPGLDEPITGGKFLLSITPTDVRLDHAALTLQPFGQSAPVLRIAASAHKSGAWHGSITLSAAAVQAADLVHYWPATLVPITRNWVTTNITAGTARDASFTLGLSAPLHLATVNLDSATGGFNADTATLTWLPGVQPLTGLNGKFTLTDLGDIDITADTAHLGGVAIASAHMHIAGVNRADQLASLNIPISGTVQDAFKVMNGPNLELLKNVPPPVPSATGEMTGTVTVVLPLQKIVTVNDVRMNVATVLSDVTLPLPVPGLVLRQGSFTVDATLQKLRVTGDAMLLGQPASVAATANFGAASGTPVTFDMKTTITAATLRNFGRDPGTFITGAMPLRVHVATTAGQAGSLTVDADLSQATLALPVFGWTKPAGKPGTFHFAADIDGTRFSGIDKIERIDAKAPGLDVETTLQGRTINLTYVRIGNTEGSGRIVPPASGKLPWDVTLTGNALDLSPVFNPPRKKIAATQPGQPATPSQPMRSKLRRPQPPSGFLWDATVHFDRLILAAGPEPALVDFNFNGVGQGDFLFEGNAAAAVEAGRPVTLTVTKQPGEAPGDAETLQLQTGDGGQLLRAMGAFDELSGGDLEVSASYGVAVPIEGVTRITNFRLLNAPAIGKILQAVTVLGIPEAASGPGLLFNRLIVPFSIDDDVLALRQARAFSASLGFTASGTIDLDASIYDVHGTVVPAYALNALPGKIPIIGKLFSPEKGGGLFAMGYTLTGPLGDPKVKINPLSALTPGFFREIFGLGKKPEAE